MNSRLLLLLLSLFLYTIQVTGQESLKISRINFDGNHSISDETLLDLMNTKPLSLLEKTKFWNKDSYFSQSILKEDLKRLKKQYQKNGFLEPDITFDLAANKKNNKVKISIHISEGVPILNGDINYYNYGSTAEQSKIDPIITSIPLKAKSRFRDEDVLATEKIIINYYKNNGYPNASLSTNISLDESLNTANLDLKISPGSKVYFGNVELQGDSLIPQSYIDKRIKLQVGESYSLAKLDQTQQDLFDTGLFRYITIKTRLDSIENSKVPVVIQVKEMPRWSFKTGLGYGTEDKIRASLLLTRLNFMGGGRTLVFEAEHSYFVPLSLDAKFTQPDLLLNDLDLILNPYLSSEREESYTVERIGTALMFQKNISKISTAYLSYQLGTDKVTITDTISSSTDEQNNKSGLTFGLNYNKANDIFSPTKGWKVNALATYMGIGFNSQYHYYKIIAEGNYYIPLGKQTVLACKVKGGIIQPVQGDESSPIEDRYLMGGALSLRGWSRNEISPVSDEDVNIGGNTMLENTVELRFPIYRILSGTTFMDFGNVWEEAWDFDMSDMLYNVGLGLRVSSPVGPIRFDIATPVFDQEMSAQFFITIGHIF